VYSKARSAQEIDPFGDARKRYLVVYPFSKTGPWYLKSAEARQGMMNEHIRLGKQFTEIHQLLLYSFGLQDHEFVVVYETDDLPEFSDLVRQLRSTEVRLYTALDAPLHTAVYLPREKAMRLWTG
ncbi:MAG TPA: chlorite dismutase family protein, partial [Anaerolineales bacterium]|nr:chlorite dismutase family protein [Anaerolineales bacterium]